MVDMRSPSGGGVQIQGSPIARARDRLPREGGLKLCYIHNIVMPGPEANTVHVAKMCSAFAANGCDVTLIAGAAPGARELEGKLRTHYGLQHAFRVVPLSGLGAKPSVAALCGALHAR